MIKEAARRADKIGKRRYDLPPALTELMVILDKEVELLQQLREVMLQVRHAVTHQELDDLRDAVGVENKLADRAAELSRLRDEKLAAAAPHFMSSAEKIATLNDLVEHLPEPAARTCRFLSEKMTAICTEIAAINRTNEALLTSAMSFVAESIDLLRGSPGESGYRPSGRPLSERHAAAVLDTTG